MSWTKAVVLASAIAALAFETYYAGGDISELRIIAVAAAALAFAAARRYPDDTAGAVMAFGYLVPSVFFIVHGHFRQWYLTPWKCALAGAMAASLRGRWQFPGRLRFSIVAWALAVAVTWPMVVGRELDWMPAFLWIRPATPSSPSVLTAVWIAQIAQLHLIGLLWIDWVFGRFRADSVAAFDRAVIRPMLGAGVLAALLAVYQGFVDLKFLSLGDWAQIGRASGALADANASGALTAQWVAIPLGIAAAARSVRSTILPVAASILLLLAVWTTGSRTALLAAAIGLAATGHLMATGSGRRLRSAAAGAAVLAIVIAAVIAVRPSITGPFARARTMLPDFSAATLRGVAWELLWARNGYGLVGAAMIGDAPLQGVGIGAFHELSVEYSPSVTGFALPADNAQNWYKHQLAELGLLGSVGWIACAVLFASVLARGRTRADLRASAVTVKYAIAGLAIASLLGMPGQNLIVALTFGTFVVWLLLMTGAGSVRDDGPSRTARRDAIAAAGLASVLAALTIWSGLGWLRQPFRAERFDFGYRYGWYAPFEGESGRTRTTGYAVVVPRAVRKWLKLTLWVEHPDADARPVRVDVRIDRNRIVQRSLPKTIPLTKYVELPGANKRFVLETRVDRTFLPPDRPSGEVGLNVAWEFLDRPPPAAPASEVLPRD